MKPREFHESIVARILPWALLQAICILAFITPLAEEFVPLKVFVMLSFGLVTFLQLKAFGISNPVLILDENRLVLRGVRPGFWKLFQRWITDTINDADITSVRIGYIREKRFGLYNAPPLGEPSRNKRFQMFLWIKHNKNGEEVELYYPHLKNVKDYKSAIECLRARFGSKYEEWL
jgi:hypothetical protein